MLFTPLIVFSSPLTRGRAGLKFFFVQRVRGLFLFIFFIMIRDLTWSYYLVVTTTAILIFKIGGFPFHQWVVQLRESVSWETLGLILTVQKIIPLYFLSVLAPKLITKLSLLRWVILGGLSLYVKQIKKLFVFSSVFFLAALILRARIGSWKWKRVLLLYLFVFLSICNFIGGELRTAPASAGALASREIRNWLFILLVLRGLPPFPGFFLKLEVASFLLKEEERFLVLTFFLRGAVFLYIYTTFILWLTLKSFSKKPRRFRKLHALSLFLITPALSRVR